MFDLPDIGLHHRRDQRFIQATDRFGFISAEIHVKTFAKAAAATDRGALAAREPIERTSFRARARAEPRAECIHIDGPAAHRAAMNFFALYIVA